MAAAFIDAFGVLAGALGIIQFGLDNFGDQTDNAAKIRIQVGLDSSTNGLSNSGGDLPDARTFRLDGGFLGITAGPGNVDDGSFAEYSVDQDNTQQPAYTVFSANDDAICVALASITWPDGQKYAWTGGFARLCDLDW